MTTDKTSGLRAHTGYWLRRISDQVHLSFERALAQHGVTVAQWTVLSAIYTEAANTPLDVATFIAIDAGAVTRLADRLVAKGLITRTAETTDRRSIRLILTERGRTLVPQLAAIADLNDAAFFGTLLPQEQRQFASLLAKLLHARNIDTTGWDRDQPEQSHN